MINLSKFTKSDIYSFILFALFKLKYSEKYSALSELIYILDEKSLLKLCKYYGGLTITIPTIDELETLVYSLVVYENVDIKKQDLSVAISELGCDKNNIDNIIDCYNSIKKVLNDYEINIK